MLREYLLCAWHWVVCFTEMIPFNPRNDLMVSTINITIVILIWQEEDTDPWRVGVGNKYHGQSHAAIKWENYI